MQNVIIPNPIEHLNHFIDMLKKHIPFTFIRFSDGEIEILRNRYLEITQGKTLFRGREFKNNFPDFDAKKFDPRIHQNIRKDLLASALFREENFYKGTQTSHLPNGIIDREFLLRLNGGFHTNMTFSDLFLNSNYEKYRKECVPLFENYEKIYVIANYRAKPTGILKQAKHIDIPDNFFATYEEVVDNVFQQIENTENGSLILSSASSLSNILGHRLYVRNPNFTFLDIGTSVNDLLTLNHNTRAYHKQENSFMQKLFYKNSKSCDIKW